MTTRIQWEELNGNLYGYGSLEYKVLSSEKNGKNWFFGVAHKEYSPWFSRQLDAIEWCKEYERQLNDY